MAEREQLEREQQQMVKVIEQQRQADLAAAEAKKVRNAHMLQQVEASNKVALDRKQQKAQMERDEDLKIVRYNAEKIQKEEAAAAEAKRIRDEKEQEIQRLREMQERAADRQGEIDALRAKRAFEEGERKARTEER